MAVSNDSSAPVFGTRTRAGGFARALQLRFDPRQFDWHVLALALALLGVGLVFLSAMAEADARYGRSGADFRAHLEKLAFALPCLVLGLCVRPRWLRRHAYLVYALALLLLALVPLIGVERNHARRWIALPIGFDLQPSELVKVALIVVLARALYRNRLESARDWLWPAALALAPMALVMAQPDLGTALTLAPIALGMCYLAGARARTLAGIVLCGLALLVAAHQFQWLRDYQLQRIDTWIESIGARSLVENRNGAAFHVYQARVAIGNGGWTGTGLGEGVANQAAHLPERDCDSIFAVIAEEGGLLGGGLFLALYAGLALSLLAAAGALRERCARLVVGGVGLYFAAHLFVNAGVNLGLLPLTGLPLPLLSTGGSVQLGCLAALGLALGHSARREPALDEDGFRA